VFSPVIGLEIHIRLNTKSKLFCSCKNSYGMEPNSTTCPVCLGMPGTLPVLNKRAVEKAAVLSLALGSEINETSFFDRKNYFYPDLPKGYQITQYFKPLAQGGEIRTIKGQRVRIKRIHLEEDAGRLVHEESYVKKDETLIDFNRSGVPLVEIVTEPVITSADDAVDVVRTIRHLVRWIDVSDGNMEQGSLRCDANLSLLDTENLGRNKEEYTEIKNLNSFKNVKLALENEIARQYIILKKGSRIERQTLLWDEKEQRVRKMRTKEDLLDYRYFREPDLPPLVLDMQWIDEIKSSMSELPGERIGRLISQYSLSREDAVFLTESRAVADYFETAAEKSPDPKEICSWIREYVLSANKYVFKGHGSIKPDPLYLAKIVSLIDKRAITHSAGRMVFQKSIETGEAPEFLIRTMGLDSSVAKKDLLRMVEQVVASFPDEVIKYRKGKKNVLDFFTGKIMAETQGRADPEDVKSLLREKIDKFHP